MIAKKSIVWPSKFILGIVILNFILQIACLLFFPVTAPCHWTEEGIVNGYMNKYFYILYYSIPILILWIFARTPKNPLVSYFYNTPAGQLIRTIIVVFTILVTWIPAYAILYVPNVISVENQVAWIAGMVYTVEASVGIVFVLICLICIITCIKLRRLPHKK